MSVSTSFIIYVILFRLSIIIAGIISIILGYRLFCRGIESEKSAGRGAELNAEIGNTKFTLKNAAPGIFFALFGVVIISIMFAAGGPELTLKTLRKSAENCQTTGEASETDLLEQEIKMQGNDKDVLSDFLEKELKMRGNNQDALSNFTKRGLDFEGEKNTTKAIEYYEKALSVMAAPMNNLAWLYLEKGIIREALPLSRMAAQFTPNDARHLDTYATALYKSGNYQEAVNAIEKAAALDTRFQNKLDEYRKSIKK